MRASTAKDGTVNQQVLEACDAPSLAWGPIPLTPFEAMIVADERPGSSMSCSAEFFFDGKIDRVHFEHAMTLALDRHRLLRAVIRGKGKKQFWHPTDKAGPLYWNHARAGTESEELPQLDLTEAPGHRCWVNVERVPGEQNADGTPRFRSILRYDFHHACCDAIGGMAFIEDLFTIYDALVHGKSPKLRPINDERLGERGKVSFASNWPTKIYRTYVDLKKSFRLILNRPLPIPNRRKCQPWEERFIVRHLPEEDLVGLRYAASDASATLNDLLLVEFLCLLRDWVRSESHAELDDRDHIRVITPVNLRDREDLQLEAANKLGFSFISRSLQQLNAADTEDWHPFITQVSAEIDQAKRLRLPAQFLKKLAIARICQRWFQRCFSTSRCWGTAILTQLGDPTRRFHTRFPREDGRVLIGNLLLSDFVSCGPLRPLTHAILSTNAYGNELTLSMRCDPTKIAKETAESVLDDFVERLKKRVVVKDTATEPIATPSLANAKAG